MSKKKTDSKKNVNETDLSNTNVVSTVEEQKGTSKTVETKAVKKKNTTTKSAKKTNVSTGTKTAKKSPNNTANKKVKKEVSKPEESSIEKKEVVAKEDSEANIQESVQESAQESIQEKENVDQIAVVESKQNKKSHKTSIIITISIFVFLLLFLLFSTIFALINNSSNIIIHGISISGIDISGLKKEEAIAKVVGIVQKQLEQPLALTHNDYETTIFLSQFDVSYDVEEAVDIAYSKGRSGNIFQNNYEILACLFFKNDIKPNISYSQETLDSLMAEMETNFSDRFIESSYYIENNSLILSKGKNGVVIERDKLKSNLLYLIENLIIPMGSMEIPTQYHTVSGLNIETIYQEVYRAPQDAHYTTNPFVVYPHVDGIDFAISKEEAQKLLDEAQEDCQIPLKVLSPNITTNQIGTEAFPDLLGNYSTNFSTSNVNRTTNIKLATNKINGTVIMPGEVFSYNQIVGKRTAAAGFKSAAVYSGGEVTTGIGGGICQVSSTLYNSALLANLEIVERYNHGFNTGYVPVGRDATVSWGGPDFKFKNTRDYPVKIIATVSGGKIQVQIFGLKSENEYEVEIQSYVTQYIQYKTIEQQDPSLPKGQTKVIQNGSNGCKSVAYRILKQNGEIVSKTLLSQDTYNPHNKIVAVGTKEEVVIPSTPTTPEVVNEI